MCTIAIEAIRVLHPWVERVKFSEIMIPQGEELAAGSIDTRVIGPPKEKPTWKYGISMDGHSLLWVCPRTLWVASNFSGAHKAPEWKRQAPPDEVEWVVTVSEGDPVAVVRAYCLPGSAFNKEPLWLQREEGKNGTVHCTASWEGNVIPLRNT